MSKLAAIAERYEESLKKAGDNYKDFLGFASRLYTMSFSDAVTLYYYDPAVTSAADSKEWQEVGRRVKRDAKGIPVIREDGKGVLLFRESDTVEIPRLKINDEPAVSLPGRWTIKADDQYSINKLFRQRYKKRFMSFGQALDHIVSENTEDHISDIYDLCRQRGYDEEAADKTAYSFESCCRYSAAVRCEYGSEDTSLSASRELYIDSALRSDTDLFKKFCIMVHNSTSETLSEIESTVTEYYKENNKSVEQAADEKNKVTAPDHWALLSQTFPNMFDGEPKNAYEIYEDKNGNRTELRFLTHGRKFTAAEILTDDHEPVRIPMNEAEGINADDLAYLTQMLQGFDHSSNTIADYMSVDEYMNMLDSATLSLDAYDLHINLSSVEELVFVVFESEKGKGGGDVFLNEYGFIQFNDDRGGHKVTYYDPMEPDECAALEKDVTDFITTSSNIQLRAIKDKKITYIPLVNNAELRTALKHISDYIYSEFDEEFDISAALNRPDNIGLAYTTVDDDNDTEHDVNVYADLNALELVTEIDGKIFKREKYESIGQMDRNVFDGLKFDELFVFTSEEYARITKEYGINEPAANSEKETEDIDSEEENVVSVLIPPITDENIIYAVLKHDQFFSKTAEEISEYFSANADTDERISFLKETINDDYSQIFLGNGEDVYGYKTYDWGMVIWEGSYLTRTKKRNIPWGELADLYARMASNGLLTAENAVTSDEVYFTSDDENIEQADTNDNGEQQSFFADLADTPAEQTFSSKKKSKKTNRRSDRKLLPASEITDEMVDFVLRCGSTERKSLERITAYFQKDKSEFDYAEFLKEEFCGRHRLAGSFLPTSDIVSLGQIGRLNVLSHDSRGYYYSLTGEGAVQLTARFEESGITIGGGERSSAAVCRTITWEEAAERIEAMFSSGSYCAKEIIDRAEDNELKIIAESLWYLHQDTDKKIYQYFIPDEMFRGGFPDSTERIKNSLRDPETLESYIGGLEKFVSDYAENRDIMRFHFHEPYILLNKLRDLRIERRDFDAVIDKQPDYEHFVSDDEITDIILGSHFDKKFEFAGFFAEEHTDKEKASFVKKYHGTGGHSIRGGWVSYDHKGYSYQRGDYDENNCTKMISWAEYASRTEAFINAGTYITRADHLERVRDCLWDIKYYIENRNENRENADFITDYEYKQYERKIGILNDYGIRTDIVLQRLTGKIVSMSASDLREGDIIRYEGHVMEVEQVGSSGITMKYNDADTFGGILQSSRLGIIHDEWVDEMNEKGIVLISRRRADEQDISSYDDEEIGAPEIIDLSDTQETPEKLTVKNGIENSNYNKLCRLYPDIMNGSHVSEVYGAQGFDDLVIDRYGTQLIMSHNYVQNGDIMYDPRIDFVIDDENRSVTPVSYENSGLGVYDEYTEGSAGQKDCSSFVKTWLNNIEQQPYKIERVYLTYNDCDLTVDYDENGEIKAIDGDDAARAAYIKDNNISLKAEKLHRVITNAGFDGGIDDKLEYTTLEEAVKAGDSYLYEGYLGYAVLNSETKIIERIEGDFPADKAFSDEVLSINGMTKRCKGSIAIYKVGDFYEIYGEEAAAASKELGLYLTKKQGREMCGFPDHAKEDHCDKLRDAGYLVVNMSASDEQTAENTLTVGDVIYMPPLKTIGVNGKPYMSEGYYGEITSADDSGARLDTFADAELTESRGEHYFQSNTDTWQHKLETRGYRYIGRADIIRSQREQNSTRLKEIVFVCSADKAVLSEIKDIVLSYGSTVTDGNKLTLFTSENYIDELKRIVDDFGGGMILDSENKQIYPEIQPVKKLAPDEVAVGDRFRHVVTGEIAEVVSLSGALDFYTDQCTVTTDKGRYAITENISYDKLLNSAFYEYIGKEQTLIPEIKNLSQMKKKLRPGMLFEVTAHHRTDSIGEYRVITSVSTVDFISRKVNGNGEPYGREIHMEFDKAKNWTFDEGEMTYRYETGELVMGFRLVDSVAEKTQTVTESTDENNAEQLSMFDAPAAPQIIEPAKEAVTEENSATWQKTSALNYVYDPANLPEKGARKRFEANYEAVSLLKRIEAEGRNVTADEQKILARYVGWGGLSAAFDPNNSSWTGEYNRLKELLDEKEYSAARSSVLTAYYSSPEIIEGIYEALNGMGFKGGNVLEPSMGIGNFFAQYPDKWKNSSHLYGVELDDITGRIAKLLYPEADIQIKGFEKTAYTDNSFDVVIGNIPFGDFKVNDKRYNKHNLNIHDYFLAKSLDQVRPGGVIAVVTSTFTLDKRTEKFRNYLAGRCDLLGAVRLPKGTFADTDTASDILFLQKREGVNTIMPEWTKVGCNSDGFKLNEYFIQHPDMILGTIKKNTRFGEESENIDIIADPSRGSLREQIQEAVSKIHGWIGQSQLVRLATKDTDGEDIIASDPNVPNQTYTILENGEVYFRSNEIMQKCKESGKRLDRIKGICRIRDIGMQLIRAEANGCDDKTMILMQEQLNAEYDRFVKKFGYLSDSANAVFSDDRYYNTICSFESKQEKEGEKVKYVKAAIFYRRTIQPEVEVLKADTPEDALIVSIDKLCRVDIGYMSELTSMPPEDIILSLKGKIYRDPEMIKADDPLSGYVEASEYLSGDVRHKLAAAKLRAEIEPDYEENIAALESIQPPLLQPGDIVLQLGHPIVEIDDYNTFIEEYANVNVEYRNTVMRTPMGEFKLANRSFGTTEAETAIYGTKRMDCYEILVRLLNGRDLKVNDRVDLPDGSCRYVVNEAETRRAQEKGKQMDAAFKKWIWEDPDRSDKYVKLYNDKYNCLVLRSYDGAELSHPGMNPDINLYPHQQNAVARAMYGNMLLAHDVGAGKTFTMGCIAADKVSRGLASRVLWLSPKSIIKQSADEVQKLYPNLKIYVLSDKLSTKKERQRSVASILSSDAEVVFMTPETFGMIPMSNEYQIDYLNRKKAEYRAYLEGLGSSRWATAEEKISIKAIEKEIKNLEERTAVLMEKHSDNSYNFEDFGFNYLIVDEYHLYFKNMYQPTKMGNIPGLQNSPSKRAEDFRMKVGYMREQYGSSFMTLATATPETNSHLEWYNMMSICDPEGLQRAGIYTADDWIKSYVVIESKYVPSPSGSGLTFRKQANSFNNVPELKAQIHEFADIVPTEKTNIVIPKRYSGKEIIISCEQSEAQKNAMESFMQRAERIHSGSVPPDIDNMLLIMHESNLCSLDQRYLDPALPCDPNGKLGTCARLVKEWYDKTNDRKGVQIVFLDRGVNEINGFSAYKALTDELTAQGIPRDEICMANDAKNDKERDAMYDELRKGKKRVVIGSRQKLGTGVNIQNKVVAMYNIDLPFTPANKKQGEGRGLRQGNENSEVAVYTLVTKGSLDTYMANLLCNKETGQQQLLDPEICCSRSISDISESALTFRDMQIATTDNPYLAEFLTLKDEVLQLEALEKDHTRQVIALERKINHEFPQQIDSIKSIIEKQNEDLKHFEENRPEKFEMVIGDVKTDEREKCAAYMEKARIEARSADESVLVGSYAGFPVYISPKRVFSETLFGYQAAYEISVQANFKYRTDYGEAVDEKINVGNTTRLENIFVNSLPKLLAQQKDRLEKLETDLRLSKEMVEKPFDHAEELKTKRERMEFLTDKLTSSSKTSALLDDSPEDDIFLATDDTQAISDDLQKKPNTVIKSVRR